MNLGDYFLLELEVYIIKNTKYTSCSKYTKSVYLQVQSQYYFTQTHDEVQL